MNITFRRLELDNFLSFQSACVNLDDNGFVLVSGENRNRDDNAQSNGSGKSAIWEAISWVLTGETLRGVKDVSNIFTQDGAVVRLFFTVDTDDYEIMRSKDNSKEKTNLKIYVNGSDKSGKGIRDSEKILKEYLPDLNSNLISSVILLGQGLPNRFSSNTPSGRKEILEKLSKSDFMIEDLKGRVSRRKSCLNDKQYSNKLVLDMLFFKQNTYKEEQEELHSNLNQLEKDEVHFEKIHEYEEKIKIIQEDILNQEEISSKNLNSIDAIKDKFDLSLLSINKEQEDIVDKYQEHSMALTNELGSIQGLLLSKKEELSRINSIETVCPTCGRPFEGVTRPDTTNLEEEIASIEKKVHDLRCALDDHKRSYQSELFSIKDKKELLLKQKTIDIDKIQKLNAEIKASIEKLKEEIAKKQQALESLRLNKNNFEEKRDALLKRIFENNEKIEEINKKILYNNNEKEIIDNRLSVINKMETILKRDFRGVLLSNVIDYISSQTKKYCVEVFETDKIDFKLNGNNIDILYCGKQYENLSGGEKQKVDIIVQFAIRDMLCKFLNFSSNIIVLDEVFDNLDELGCQKILDLITKHLPDVESVFVITHHSDISIPFDNKIIVIKDNDGISRIS